MPINGLLATTQGFHMTYSISDRLYKHFIARPRFSNTLPRFYLDSFHDPDNPTDLHIYFVNNSPDQLEWVKVIDPLIFTEPKLSGGYLKGPCLYQFVKPGEAVKVAEFDEVFDSDLLHRIHVVWKCENLPEEEANIVGKGITKFKYRVLQWLEKR